MSQNQVAACSVEEQRTGFRLRQLPSPFAFPLQMGDRGIVDIVALLWLPQPVAAFWWQPVRHCSRKCTLHHEMQWGGLQAYGNADDVSAKLFCVDSAF